MTQVGHADLESQRSPEGSEAEANTVWARRDSLGPAGGLSGVRCNGCTRQLVRRSANRPGQEKEGRGLLRW